MIRFLLIVLMFALPAQFAWAAAAGYCTHESNPVSFHVGHHVHEHRAPVSDADSTDIDDPTTSAKGLFAQGHADCGYCHGLVAQFAVPRASTLGSLPRDVDVESTTIFFGSRIGDDIDRPKWTRTG